MTELGAKIGEGRTAEIYRISEDRVLKLYQDRFDRKWVETAAHKARVVAAAGVRTPAVHDVVTYDDQHGIVMDWIAGQTMFDEMLARPNELDDIGRALAELHLGVHQLFPGGHAKPARAAGQSDPEGTGAGRAADSGGHWTRSVRYP